MVESGGLRLSGSEAHSFKRFIGLLTRKWPFPAGFRWLCCLCNSTPTLLFSSLLPPPPPTSSPTTRSLIQKDEGNPCFQDPPPPLLPPPCCLSFRSRRWFRASCCARHSCLRIKGATWISPSCLLAGRGTCTCYWSRRRCKEQSESRGAIKHKERVLGY